MNHNKFFDADIEKFFATIKIGKLYFTTEKISGSPFPPEKIFFDGAPTWVFSAKYFQKKFGLTKEQSLRKAVFVEIFANSIILPVEFEHNNELIKIIHEDKILWVSTQYLANNTVLVPIEKLFY